MSTGQAEETTREIAPDLEAFRVTDKERQVIELLRHLQSGKKYGSILLRYDGGALVQVLEAKPVKTLEV